MAATTLAPRPDAEPSPERLRAAPLTALLARAARRAGSRVCLSDPPGRLAWSGRFPAELDAGAALGAVERLASALGRLGLEPGARVGICLPGGSEACLALLAVESAGLTPCLLPLAAEPDVLAGALRATSTRAVVTQAWVGDLRPAEMFCTLASEWLPLRFLLAFGPDVPDGVVDLDRVLAEDRSGPARRPPSGTAETGLVTFAPGPGGLLPFTRSARALLAATAALLRPDGVRPGDRIVTWLPGHDLKSLVTGWMAALVAEATLECHGLFEADAFIDASRRGDRVHLVLPGWAGHLLVDRTGDACGSVSLVHAAPVDLSALEPLAFPVVDVLALGEAAVIAAGRVPGGKPALASAISCRPGTGPELLGLRLTRDGSIELRGLAAAATPLGRSGAPDAEPAPAWRGCGFAARSSEDRLLSVT